MTERKRNILLETPSTLYLGLIKNLVIGVFVAFFCYFVVLIGMNFFINNIYLSEGSKQDRVEEYIADLQDFVDGEAISSEDFDKISGWAQDNRYIYLLLYNEDNTLFFASDKDSEDTGGATVGYPSRDELIAAAMAGGLHSVELTDGTLLVSVAEYSEYRYYDIANVLSFVTAFIALGVVLVNYIRQIISRIKKLEGDVSTVAAGNTEHLIFVEGRDEISGLSEGVERMRRAMLLNLEREREAMDANKELVTSMSHDIRTPLTVLLGYLDMMKTQTEDDEVLHGYVLSSEKTAMRLKQLSDDMFQYSLAFGDVGSKIELEEYDARTLTEQMLSEHILLLMEQGYEVKLDNFDEHLDEGSVLLTDAPNLMRIIDNVFSNIYKYADPKQPIEIRAKRVGNSIVTFEFKNSVRKDNFAAESNRIGLKTCAKLARFIAEGFSCDNDGDTFTAKLSLKITAPRRIG